MRVSAQHHDHFRQLNSRGRTKERSPSSEPSSETAASHSLHFWCAAPMVCRVRHPSGRCLRVRRSPCAGRGRDSSFGADADPGAALARIAYVAGPSPGVPTAAGIKARLGAETQTPVSRKAYAFGLVEIGRALGRSAGDSAVMIGTSGRAPALACHR